MWCGSPDCCNVCVCGCECECGCVVVGVTVCGHDCVGEEGSVCGGGAALIAAVNCV